jgi:Na+/H+ antiporter NhaA
MEGGLVPCACWYYFFNCGVHETLVVVVVVVSTAKGSCVDCSLLCSWH